MRIGFISAKHSARLLRSDGVTGFASAVGRHLSTDGGSVVDDIIRFVREECKGKPEQAVDVLRSGLSMPLPGDAALHGARLLLEQGEVQAEAGHWEECVDACRNSTAKLDCSTGPGAEVEAVAREQIALAAATATVRGLLVLGRDDDAAAAAADAHDRAQRSFQRAAEEEERRGALMSGAAAEGTVAHARLDFGTAREHFAAVQALYEHANLRSGPPREPDARVTAALNATAAFRLALGERETARDLVEAATATAAALPAEPPGSAAGIAPRATADIDAGILLVGAQCSSHAEEWEQAEAALSGALVRAEAVGGERHARVALPLLVTGEIYSRTGRVTLAEGLYRECAKMLLPAGGGVHGCHASVGALLCWRYAQLLNALPKRGREAESWADRARKFFAATGGWAAGHDIEAAFGGLQAHKGGVGWGSGGVVDQWSRRVLPCAASP